MRDSYTRYPRAILWLVRGGEVTIGGDEADASPRFSAEVEPFYIGKLPITNEQYEAFDPGFERSTGAAADRDPAVGVSWEDASAYCEWYGGVSRKPMRLPTEVEWEHACRAGREGKTFIDEAAGEELDDHVWDRDNSDGRMRQLDAKQANDFGLYGMLGGVWEWTSSVYRSYPLTGAAAAGEEPGGEVGRVLRGGSFRTPRDEISCSVRRGEEPAARFDDAGFRIVKSFRRG